MDPYRHNALIVINTAPPKGSLWRRFRAMMKGTEKRMRQRQLARLPDEEAVMYGSRNLAAAFEICAARNQRWWNVPTDSLYLSAFDPDLAFHKDIYRINYKTTIL